MSFSDVKMYNIRIFGHILVPYAYTFNMIMFLRCWGDPKVQRDGSYLKIG